MAAAPHLLTRRTALALGAAGLVALTGCDGTDAGRAPVSQATPDPDTALVQQVLGELADAERLAVAAGSPDLAVLHRAQIKALAGPPPTPAPGRTGTEVLRRRERRLQADLVEASVAAQSGALARLLASMSAAVSQQLAVL